MMKFILVVLAVVGFSNAIPRHPIGLHDLAEELMEDIFRDVQIHEGVVNLEDELFVENDGNACSGDTCIRSSILKNGQCLHSSNKQYKACMQHDGNFVVYCIRNGAHKATWASGTHGKVVKDGLYFQADGNLVLYNYCTKAAIWASGTHSTEAHKLIMQGDGNLVVYGYHHNVFWESGTNGKC